MPVERQEEYIFRIVGLDCASCAGSLESGIGHMKGVQTCSLSFATGRMVVSGSVGREAVIERIRALGFDVALEDEAVDAGLQTKASGPVAFLHFLWQRWDTRLALIGAILVLPSAIAHELLHIEHIVFQGASIIALLIAGWPIGLSAFRGLVYSRQIRMTMLMTIAAIGAVYIGAYTEAAMVMVLFAIGEALEGYTTSRARDSIRQLMAVVPQEATLLRRAGQPERATQPIHDNGQPVGAQRIPIAELAIGDVIIVKPGERIPMDGVVRAGMSTVNQAPITGESTLVEKSDGAHVFASSINGAGALEIEVTHSSADNTISRLIKMVEEAQERRAPVQRFVDRFAHYYTPLVVLVALFTAIVPPLVFGQPFLNVGEHHGWFYRSLALLLVACPCALVISTPVSIISAISNGARNGVLFKGGAYLEKLSSVSAIAFDKTGTLTEGKPAVVAVRSTACLLPNADTGSSFSLDAQTERCAPCDDLLARVCAVEQKSEHPLATAIVREAIRRGVYGTYAPAEQVHALAGQSVSGYVQGQHIVIGSHRYFDATVPHSQEDCLQATHDAEQGYTPMLVGCQDSYLGRITASDTVRASSAEAIASLRDMGIGALVMLTGDNRHAATKVSESVGITAIEAELLPEEKVAAIESLRAQHACVAMVGDGINDAPALATADVGIALGGASGGTAEAMETADVTLMGDDLRRLPFAIRLSKATMRTIGVNVVLSLGIKLGFLVLVLAGLGTMWMAVLSDMGTSLLVTLNGMRLLGLNIRP